MSAASVVVPRGSRAANGGVPARRAVARWAWRLFRREWRQQLLILALLVVAVGATVLGSAVAVDTPPSSRVNFGTADQSMTIQGSGPSVTADIASVQKYFGAVDVIENQLLSSGTVTPVELRAMDPHGAFSGPLLSLLSGRYPSGAHQVALTPEVASTYDVKVGGTWTAGGVSRDVVGLVQNPLNYADEFALVVPGQVSAPTEVTVLFDASGARISQAESEGYAVPSDAQIATYGGPGQSSGGFAPEFVVLAIEVFGLLFIGLVSVAGFTVLAQRRLRSLGILGSLGATDRHIRLALLANGVVVGVVAAIIGTALGVLGWVIYHPHLELSAGHVVGLWALPWGLIALAVALAVVTAVLAARRPARVMARVPIVVALSGRPERHRDKARSALRGGVITAIGFVLLIFAGQSSRGGGGADLLELAAGLVLLIVGGLSFATIAVGELERFASAAPVAARLALRNLARYRSRSGSSLAAIGFAIMLAVITFVAATARYSSPIDYFGPNMASNQMVFYAPGWSDNGLGGGPGQKTNPGGSTPSLAQVTAKVDAAAAYLGTTNVLALEASGENIFQTNSNGGEGNGGVVYVATPNVLRHYGISASAIDQDTIIITSRPGLTSNPNLFVMTGNCQPQQGSGFIQGGCYGDPKIQTFNQLPRDINVPNILFTTYAVKKLHMHVEPAAWLIQGAKPFTQVQISQAREFAASVGALIETKNQNPSLVELDRASVVFGYLLALGVLAMTLGLLRTETASDMRILTAAGASSYTRRIMAGTTEGVLAFMGALLGTVIAYMALIAAFGHQANSDLLAIPWRSLFYVIVGLPIVAALGGWLFAGREPKAIARQPLE